MSDARSTIAALLAYARGGPQTLELATLLSSARASGENTLWRLRRSADVLAAGAATPRWLRALGTELFRSQNEFNHTVVDVLEDLPWLAGRPERVTQRLARWQRFAAMPPQRKGARGTAVRLAKSVALIAAERTLEPMLGALHTANLALTARVVALASGKSPTHSNAGREGLDRAAGSQFGAWVSAQLAFLAAVDRLLAERGARLIAWKAPEQPALSTSPHPSVSVLLVGSGPVPQLEGALEVLCDGEPPASIPNARCGDVANARGEVLLRLPAGESLLPGGLAALAQPFSAAAVELAWGDALMPDGRPALRPSWSPETLWSWTFTGGCFAIRTSAAKKAQLSRRKPALEWLLSPRFEGAQTARVPRLVSRAAASTVSMADVAVVQADLERRGAHGVVKLHGEQREVRLLPHKGTRVSIIVPFRDRPELLENLWASLRRYEAGVDWELLLIDNGSVEGATRRLLASMRDARVHHIAWPNPFNYSELNNRAARSARGDLLLFLNNDISVRHADWLADLAGYAQLPEVGVVGARLLYPDDSLQHAGVAIGLKGLAGHVFARWRPEYGSTPFGPPDITRNWSAVTGACMLMRREVFNRGGGFDERLKVSGGDVALCLAVRRLGLRTVCVGHVSLYHHESQSRGRDPVPAQDVLGELSAYSELLAAGDPHYHPSLATDAAHGGPGLELSDPVEHAARAMMPWLPG